MTRRDEAKQLHESVNQTYAEYNYVLHLDAVEAAHQEFKDELDIVFDFPNPNYKHDEYDKKQYTNGLITNACFYHDTIEDCRVTPNDLLKEHTLDRRVVEIVFAVTNNKGWTRDERANSEYYFNIRKTPGASFVKMCDRIANVRFSRMVGSSMFSKYKKENEDFMKKIGADRFPRMKECLINLFK